MGSSAVAGTEFKDINADGVKEKIVRGEVRRETYYLASMTIYRKDAIVYQAKNLKTDAMTESVIRFADADKRYPGLEILEMRPDDTVLVEGADCRLIDEMCYQSTIHRWNGKKYEAYWEVKTPFRNRTIDKVVKDIIGELPRFEKGWQRAEVFIKAIAAGKWTDIKKTMDPDGPQAGEYKKLQVDCKNFPLSKSWAMFASPHDRKIVCFIARDAKSKKAWTIVVAPDGVKMWPGDEWD